LILDSQTIVNYDYRLQYAVWIVVVMFDILLPVVGRWWWSNMLQRNNWPSNRRLHRLCHKMFIYNINMKWTSIDMVK